MRKKRKQNRILILLLAFIIIVAFAFTFNLTNSRYIGQVTAEEEVLAVPIINLVKDDANAQNIFQNIKPGDTVTYDFSVSNFDGDKINEIELKYVLKPSIGNLPLKFTITDITNGVSNNIAMVNNNESEPITMEFGTKITRNYRLTAQWNASDNNIEYANASADFKLELQAEQVLE